MAYGDVKCDIDGSGMHSLPMPAYTQARNMIPKQGGALRPPVWSKLTQYNSISLPYSFISCVLSRCRQATKHIVVVPGIYKSAKHAQKTFGCVLAI